MQTSPTPRDGLARSASMAAVLVAAGIGLAHGDEMTQGLFGNWGGLRSALFSHGVDLQVSYINEFAANVSGGASREQADADQFYFGGTIDMQRLAGIPGGSIVFSFTDRNGESLSLKARLHTLLEVQEIYGEGNWTRLNQLYWEQDLFGDTLELKLGRLTGTFDFMPFSCYFQNISFCATLPSHNVVANWIAFPGSTWAGVLRANLQHDLYFQAGVYEVNPDFQLHQHRFAFGEPFDGPGTREVVEVGWLPKSAGSSEGGYRLGAWYDNFGGDDLYLNSEGKPLAIFGGVPWRRHQQHGFYAMAQQRVWAQGDSETRGISLFANFVQTDRHIATIGQIAEVGLFWTGPLNARPGDDLGLAVGRVHVNSLIARGDALYNSELAASAGLAPTPIPREEYPVELFYSVNVTPAITIRPNIQFIHAPGGVNERADIWLFGAHLAVQL